MRSRTRLLVVSFLPWPVISPWVGFLTGGGDYSRFDVAFVPNMCRSVEGLEESGIRDGPHVINTVR